MVSCVCVIGGTDRSERKLTPEFLKGLNATFEEKQTPLLIEAIAQLTSYFDQKRTTFELPILLVATVFQQTVWKALQ